MKLIDYISLVPLRQADSNNTLELRLLSPAQVLQPLLYGKLFSPRVYFEREWCHRAIPNFAWFSLTKIFLLAHRSCEYEIYDFPRLENEKWSRLGKTRALAHPSKVKSSHSRAMLISRTRQLFGIARLRESRIAAAYDGFRSAGSWVECLIDEPQHEFPATTLEILWNQSASLHCTWWPVSCASCLPLPHSFWIWFVCWRYSLPMRPPQINLRCFANKTHDRRKKTRKEQKGGR